MNKKVVGGIDINNVNHMTYENFCIYCYQNVVGAEVVGLNSNDISRANQYHNNVFLTKMGETQYQIDGKSLNTRMVTGALGEIAVEKLVGIKVFDDSVGTSSQYNHPDVEKLNVGVKTVEFGKIPIVPIKGRNKYPQIICVLVNPNTVVVCGVATPEVLDEYQSMDLVLSKDLRDRKCKSGFFGFDKLIPIHDYFSLPPRPVANRINWKPQLIDCKKKAA